MKLRGGLFYIMCRFNPEYKQHVRYEYGKKFLYLLLIREIYCLIYSEFLWCNILSTTLEGEVFEITPYNRCVAITIIEVTQFTIACYVNDKNYQTRTQK